MATYHYENEFGTPASNLPQPQGNSFMGMPQQAAQANQVFQLTPALPTKQQIDMEELQDLGNAYLNLLTCAALFQNNYQSSGLDVVQYANPQNPSQVIYHVRFNSNKQTANLEVDQAVVDQAHASFRQYVPMDMDASQVNLIIDLNGEIAFETFNKTSKQRIQYIRLPLTEPTVPLDVPADSVPAAAASPAPQPPEVIQPPASSPTPQLDYDISIMEMANEICRTKPITMMDLTDLQFIAQAFLLTRPSGCFVPVEEAAKIFQNKFGAGWSQSSIQRHINSGTPFTWIPGFHYLGKSKRASYINLDAVEQSLLEADDE